jgi:hypothetical protein
MTGEIAPSGPSGRSTVWVPHIVRELSAHLAVDAMPADRSVGRSPGCGSLLGVEQGRPYVPALLSPPIALPQGTRPRTTLSEPCGGNGLSACQRCCYSAEKSSTVRPFSTNVRVT